MMFFFLVGYFLVDVSTVIHGKCFCKWFMNFFEKSFWFY
jgi:hypothetical protein